MTWCLAALKPNQPAVEMHVGLTWCPPVVPKITGQPATRLHEVDWCLSTGHQVILPQQHLGMTQCLASAFRASCYRDP